MSSLSQEDLDAGWDDIDIDGSAAQKAESASVVPQASTPPNSIIVERSPAPVESLVVPAAPSETSGSADAFLPPPEPNALEGLGHPEPDAPVSENRARSTAANVVEEVTEQATEPPTKPADAEPAIAQTGDSTVRSAEAAPADLLDARPEPFVIVAEKPQLLADRGVETRVETHDTAAEGTSDAASTEAEAGPQDDSTASPKPAIQIAEDESIDVSVIPAAFRDGSVDEQLAVEMVSKLSSESYITRHWRVIAITAASILLLTVGLLTIRSKHQNGKLDQSSATNPADHAAPVGVMNQATPPNLAASASASAAIAAPGPGRLAPGASAQSESFSDAFVKHAAAINSSWAEVKKRSKSIDSSQSNKPVAASNAESNDDPLDVLDKLEKARKAKKQVGKSPGSP